MPSFTGKHQPLALINPPLCAQNADCWLNVQQWSMRIYRPPQQSSSGLRAFRLNVRQSGFHLQTYSSFRVGFALHPLGSTACHNGEPGINTKNGSVSNWTQDREEVVSPHNSAWIVTTFYDPQLAPPKSHFTSRRCNKNNTYNMLFLCV